MMAYAVQIMGVEAKEDRMTRLLKKQIRHYPLSKPTSRIIPLIRRRWCPGVHCKSNGISKKDGFWYSVFVCLFVRRISNSASGSLKMTPMMTGRYNIISEVWDRISTVGQSIVNTVIEDRIESADNTIKENCLLLFKRQIPKLKKKSK